MKTRFIVLFALLLTVSVSVLSAAPSAEAQDRPCLVDAQRLCQNLAADDRNGMMQCLKEHEADLSDACKARLQTFTHEPCAQDALTFCPNVELGNKRALVHCLRDHTPDLADGCKARLQEFWARML